MARKPRSPSDLKQDVALGKRLAKLRRDQGFTQTELADLVDVVQVVISDYERGKLRPHPIVLAKLALALQVSADVILGIQSLRSAERPTLNRRFLRRLKAIDQLPKRDQDALLRTIDAFLTARKAS